MTADYDQFSFDDEVLDDIEDLVVPRVRYWIGNCDNTFIPDHIKWLYKKRLYLITLRLSELQQECENALCRSPEFPSEKAWLEDWAINRALEKLQKS